MFGQRVQKMGLLIILFAVLGWTVIDHGWPKGQQYAMVATEAVTSETEMHKQIQEAAEKYNEPAVDAEIHNVWKALPGYNGYEVDEQASFQAMAERGHFHEQDLVFRETKPDVQFQDLPAAPLFRGNEQKSAASLLINVAWGEAYIPDMLQTLRDFDVKATFFLDGSWVKSHPKLATMIKEEGHEIGNHAYSHPDMAQLSEARVIEELEATQEVIEAVLHTRPVWFAPPSGSYRDVVVDLAHERNMRTVMWTVDTVDWKEPAEAELLDRVKQNLHPGATILMHPTEVTSQSLPALIEAVEAEGLELQPLSTFVSEKRISQAVEN
ncbi:putative sporulation protein (polysaccharide deacetylase family) [Salsuginibacillus halophilus]|uniref:Putative sporulation protein (Polysaccharide deacetylase family) n=1 Tax=Salsuginibacillus halophilus TaxID=517424 RepID=A0A2P8HYC2_9BACI|nr:polysaccharide deacetylase family protein [Salsuginibacillus halophilus]PSL51238.1 putative sporulation protein (polysaccharide deacetylase family) [Salsuginibacillus halophilus]